MSKQKLDAVRKLYASEEVRSAQTLKHTQQQRQTQQAQADSLQEMLDQYRDDYIEIPLNTIPNMLRFQKFYQQITQTLQIQAGVMQQLKELEARHLEHWHQAYRRREAIDRICVKRADEISQLARRKERRSTPANSTSWSMLNPNDNV